MKTDGTLGERMQLQNEFIEIIPRKKRESIFKNVKKQEGADADKHKE